jgi:hypothetical protein
MAAVEKKDGERWEKIQRSVDLLFTKVEAQDEMHQQMSTRMELTSQALT